MNIGLWLQQQAIHYPDRPALYRGTELVADYGAFHDQALTLAGALREIGVKPGDRVALFLENCPDYLIILYGIWYAGAVAVPINAKLHAREAAFILEQSGTALIFASEPLAVALLLLGQRLLVQREEPSAR